MKTRKFIRKCCHLSWYNLHGEILGSVFCTVKMLKHHFEEHLKIWTLEENFYIVDYVDIEVD